VRLRRLREPGERHERDEGQERRFHRSIRCDAAGRVVDEPSTAWRRVISPVSVRRKRGAAIDAAASCGPTCA
jgi:hypothetical protein